MDKLNFDWDEANISHIAEHNVTPDEAEETLTGDPLEMDCDVSEDGEQRWSYLGETASGRLLYLVITLRNEKVRVITAFDPPAQDKRLYLETKARLHDGFEDS
jgi:uncharacterized DUF497 family protein